MTASTGTKTRRKELLGTGLKECCDCLVVMPVSEFTPVARKTGLGISHYAASCRACRNQRNRAYRAADPGRVKANAYLAHVARTYGLTPEKYNEMFASQKGCCAICSMHQTETKTQQMHVDHDHESGKVRGLLCGPCNTALGMLREDETLLLSAIAYLKKAT